QAPACASTMSEPTSRQRARRHRSTFARPRSTPRERWSRSKERATMPRGTPTAAASGGGWTCRRPRRRGGRPTTGASHTSYPGQPTIPTAGWREPTQLDGPVNGLSWTPAGDALYAIVLHDDTGLSSLEKISRDGAATTVRPELDASPFFNSLAFSSDGRVVYL